MCCIQKPKSYYYHLQLQLCSSILYFNSSVAQWRRQQQSISCNVTEIWNHRTATVLSPDDIFLNLLVHSVTRHGPTAQTMGEKCNELFTCCNVQVQKKAKLNNDYVRWHVVENCRIHARLRWICWATVGRRMWKLTLRSDSMACILI